MDTHKIFTMDETKRNALFSAAMDEFAKNGYKKTTTDAIISKAGISKGLLFHYFGTKKDLYIYLFKYANKIIMNEYYEKIDYKSKDIFLRLKRMILLKFELTGKYPAVFDFVSSAYFENDPAVANEIDRDVNNLYAEASSKLIEDIDMSLFKPGFDSKRTIEIILFTLKGYSETQISPGKKIDDYRSEYDRYAKEIDEYIAVLRAAFYKEKS
jgi:TetR/AcrR family transcriptional regulator